MARYWIVAAQSIFLLSPGWGKADLPPSCALTRIARCGLIFSPGLLLGKGCS